jgi:hypothetical protein
MIYLKFVTKEVEISYCGVGELMNQLSWMQGIKINAKESLLYNGSHDKRIGQL